MTLRVRVYRRLAPWPAFPQPGVHLGLPPPLGLDRAHNLDRKERWYAPQCVSYGVTVLVRCEVWYAPQCVSYGVTVLVRCEVWYAPQCVSYGVTVLVRCDVWYAPQCVSYGVGYGVCRVSVVDTATRRRTALISVRVHVRRATHTLELSNHILYSYV